MSNSIPGNHKHMTQDDRISIEKGLDDGLSMRKIAEPLGKDPSTISKEIKKHRTLHAHNAFNEPSNKCALFAKCIRKGVCGNNRPLCDRLCKKCHICNRICPDFIQRSYHCDLLDKALLYATDAPKSSTAGLTNIITGQRPHTGSIRPSWSDPVPASTCPKKMSGFWMNWSPH